MDINNISINNIPSVKKREIGYRTITNSSEQNEYQTEILSDILDLFNKANSIEKGLGETKTILDTENKYLQIKISELETIIASITQKYIDLTSSVPNAFRTIQLYPNNATLDSDNNGAFIDLQNMDITMKPVVSTSKLGLYDEYVNQIFLPSSLKVDVGPSSLKVGTHIFEVKDNEVINAFKDEQSSYWIRKVVTDNTVNEIISELIITMPEDIITTRNINTIIVNPYPINATDIVSIEYKSDGSWTPLNCFKDHANTVLEEYADMFGTVYGRPVIKDAPNLKFNFKEIQANQIKIVFRQRHYLQEDQTKRIFYLGAKNIQILQNQYSKDYNTFNMAFEFPENSSNILFEKADVIFNNPNEVVNNENLIQYEYFYIDGVDIPHKLNGSLPITVPSKKMLIKFKIFQGLATPNIRSIKVKYKPL